MTTFDLMKSLQRIADDERVDFHARGTCEIAITEIERLRDAMHEAFMAMCAHRDHPDDEPFQDAIDALGVAVHGQDGGEVKAIVRREQTR